MKYTKSEVQGMFNRLAKAMNKPIDGGSRNGLALDYVACYGGYVIEEYAQKDGLDCGVDHSFGSMRRSAREMYLSMLMTTQALEDVNQREWKNNHAKFLQGGSL